MDTSGRHGVEEMESTYTYSRESDGGCAVRSCTWQQPVRANQIVD
jgi:hypothetical protein